MYSSTSSAPLESRNLADETAAVLSTDEVAIIFSFLSYDEIMYARVCTTWRDAAKKTLVPLTEFQVYNVRSYNAMRVMSTALPNLQQLTISNLGHGRKYHKYTDGEDPDEGRAAITANDTAFNIDIISRFSKLRILKINMAPLNGRYPVLFNFPLLQKLTISDFNNCSILKWDLEMLSGLPSLKELFCENNSDIAGSLSSLRVLKDTLEKVKFIDCRHVEGNLMDLADFPRLKELGLSDTAVTGDIRDINGHDFPALEYLSLPKGVYGGIGYKFEDISDVPEFMQAIHHLLQRSPTLFKGYDSPLIAFYWTLSKDSPNWYDRELGHPSPPFRVELIQAGSRRGWWWYSGDYGNKIHSCEINWLDPEPSSECSDYEAYIEKQLIERNIDFYRGYHQPPTEEEYRRLCEGLP